MTRPSAPALTASLLLGFAFPLVEARVLGSLGGFVIVGTVTALRAIGISDLAMLKASANVFGAVLWAAMFGLAFGGVLGFLAIGRLWSCLGLFGAGAVASTVTSAALSAFGPAYVATELLLPETWLTFGAIALGTWLFARFGGRNVTLRAP